MEKSHRIGVGTRFKTPSAALLVVGVLAVRLPPRALHLGFLNEFLREFGVVARYYELSYRKAGLQRSDRILRRQLQKGSTFRQLQAESEWFDLFP